MRKNPTADAFDRVEEQPVSAGVQSYIEQMSAKQTLRQPTQADELARKAREQREREHGR